MNYFKYLQNNPIKNLVTSYLKKKTLVDINDKWKNNFMLISCSFNKNFEKSIIQNNGFELEEVHSSNNLIN